MGIQREVLPLVDAVLGRWMVNSTSHAFAGHMSPSHPQAHPVMCAGNGLLTSGGVSTPRYDPFRKSRISAS